MYACSRALRSWTTFRVEFRIMDSCNDCCHRTPTRSLCQTLPSWWVKLAIRMQTCPARPKVIHATPCSSRWARRSTPLCLGSPDTYLSLTLGGGNGAIDHTPHSATEGVQGARADSAPARRPTLGGHRAESAPLLGRGGGNAAAGAVKGCGSVVGALNGVGYSPQHGSWAGAASGRVWVASVGKLLACASVAAVHPAVSSASVVGWRTAALRLEVKCGV